MKRGVKLPRNIEIAQLKIERERLLKQLRQLISKIQNKKENNTTMIKTIETDHFVVTRVLGLPVDSPITLEYRFQRYDKERTYIVTPPYDRYLFTLGEYQYTLTREQTRTALAQPEWRENIRTYPKRKLAIDEEIYDRVDGLIPGGVRPWPVVPVLSRKWDPRELLKEMSQEDMVDDLKDVDLDFVPGTNAAFDIEGGDFHYQSREEITEKLRVEENDRYRDKMVRLAKKQAKEGHFETVDR